MRKLTHLDSLDHPRRSRSKVPLVLLFVLTLVATPPLFEAGKLGLARWRLCGLTTPVETPILDALAAQWALNSSEFREWVTPLLANRRWNPKLVLPIAFFWTALAARMLRRGH